MNKGKLIVLDGLDGCGKSTQLTTVSDYLSAQGYRVRTISYPCYNSPSASLVNMYLGGEFGDNPDAVNAYVASTFYAADRVANYLIDWRHDYENGAIILAGRYTTSNAIHQMSKLTQKEWDAYLDWLEDYEYCKLALPHPDLVIYLRMDLIATNNLLAERYHGDVTQEDIHERDKHYQHACADAARYAASRLGWTIIDCAEGNKILPVEEIRDKILAKILPLLS